MRDIGSLLFPTTHQQHHRPFFLLAASEENFVKDTWANQCNIILTLYRKEDLLAGILAILLEFFLTVSYSSPIILKLQLICFIFTVMRSHQPFWNSRK